MNNSEDFCRATMSNQGRNRRWPKNSKADNISVAFSAAKPSVRGRASPVLANAGIIMISATTARSWNNSTPMIFLPCGVFSSARSTSILLTIAVDDIASTPPRAKPARQSNPKKSEVSMTSNIVATTCAVPKPNTARCMVRKRARLNSSPMLNIRNTTPNSARWRVSGASGIQPSTCGPIMTPTIK